MKRVTKSSRSGNEDGGSDDDDGIPTKRSTFPKIRRVSWVLGGLTVLLILQRTAVAALASSIPINPNLGGTIDIPFEDEAPPQKERFTGTFEPNEDPSQTETGYDLDYTKLDNRTVLKTSEKTMEEYRKFIVNNCRETLNNWDTFFTWEHDQFASHLKEKISSIADKKALAMGKETENTKRLRALLAPGNDAVGILKSLCKSTYVDYAEDERIRNHKLENEIVNTVFANLYRNGRKGLPFKIRDVPRNRQNLPEHLAYLMVKEEEEDEAFGKEVAKALRR